MHLGRIDHLAEDQLRLFPQPGRNACAGGNRLRMSPSRGHLRKRHQATAGDAPQARQLHLMAEFNQKKAGSSTSMPRPAGWRN